MSNWHVRQSEEKSESRNRNYLNEKQWITYDESVIIDEWNYAYQIVQILIMNQELGDVKWVKMNHFIQSDWETQMSWTLRIYQNS